MSDEKQNQLLESVSALMDNQASHLELQRILAHTEKHSGVRSRWHRYHLARSVMQGEANTGFTSVADRVKAAVSELDIDIQPKSSDNLTQGPQVENRSTNLDTKDQTNLSNGRGGWWQSLGRVAIAASVTVVAVFGANQLPQFSIFGEEPAVNLAESNSEYQPVGNNYVSGLNPNLNFQNVSISSAPVPMNSAPVITPSQTQQRWEEEQIRQALQRLMLEHAQQSAIHQNQGLMPFIKVSDSALNQQMGQ